MRLRAAAAAALCAALVSGAPAMSIAATHQVTIEGMQFTPARLELRAGDTVVWTNKDLVPHTVTATAAGIESGQIDGGKSFRFVVRKPGDIEYVCRFHPGMKASLVAR